MQYFTFLGLGANNKSYKEVLYFFEDNLKNNEVADCGQFIQAPIINKFAKELKEVYVFATKESIERNWDSLWDNLKEFSIPINVITIDKDVSFNYFSKQLMENMKENEEVIIDITNCFRHIPTKLLFALNYIELTKKAKIKHLYYGKIINNGEECVIEDFIEDYQLHKVATLLYQFDKTLMLNSTEIQPFLEIDSSDAKINIFLKNLSSLNEMIEFCEFDQCIKTIRIITESCNSILKEEDKYRIIIPIINSIKNKFKTYNSCRNDVEKKEELIKIILLHKRYQVAVTFIDQFFREELIRCLVTPNQYKLESYDNNEIYSFSQFLISTDGYSIRNTASNIRDFRKKNRYLKLIEIHQETFNKNVNKLTIKDKKMINVFYDGIRNHMNHAATIDQTKFNFNEIVNNMMNIIRKLRKGD